jgi:hypothetical protein
MVYPFISSLTAGLLLSLWLTFKDPFYFLSVSCPDLFHSLPFILTRHLDVG